MKKILNHILEGKHDKPILVDVFYKETHQPKPVVIFCHGYKGFKDWGAWNLMAEAYANAGFYFVKFNFSYNGGTVEQPIDFPDLEAFGNNNYTKELDDLETVIDWVCNKEQRTIEADVNNITLIGHSRGGGIVTIKASEDKRVKSVISLAGVCDLGKRTATIGELEQWKKDGVKYVLNGRTKQQMPHFYQFYENFKENEVRLNIKRAVKELTIPHLIIHGDNDTSVLIREGELQHEWNPGSVFNVVKDANHVFNAKHPWKENTMPKELEETIKLCVTFVKK
ncbi:alpha/beta hydrolase [Tenacibaculum holothuriorum]|uniref:Alpha/beta hydrolase n=1 Tax=Tenacibaculum holothuriorum TaxID=1635173 RepID=A0A1Y2PFD2_9FLAO|nr:alpha/beta hydrolase [Tenacibaculum holothuriorum]OSY88880.1 alpha/beta hydrolase [Tenacibaculum holothuriorum]